MKGDDTMTIFAVPCDQLPVLTQEQGEKLLEQIHNKPPRTQDEKENLARRVKAIYGKPGATNEQRKLLH